MGHVVAKQEDTVTLPYGFKTVSIGVENNGIANLAHAAGDLVAENTQDTINVNSGNKWIKLAATADSDSVAIGHLVQSIDTQPAFASDINGNGDTITVQDITHDEAGHIRKNKAHTYTLPYGFKTITGNGGSLVARSTQDTVALSGDDWIRVTASGDGIKFEHREPITVEPKQIGVLVPHFGETFDITG